MEEERDGAGEGIPEEWLAEVAAFLDGRLSGTRREAFLARVAESDALYRLLLDSDALLQADDQGGVGVEAVPASKLDHPPLDFPPAGPVVQPPLPRSGGNRRWLLTAAVAAAAAVLVWVVADRRAVSITFGPLSPLESTAILIPALSSPLPSGWAQEVWSATRGGGAGGASGIRAGARLVELDVALELEDSDAVAVATADLASLAETQVGGGPLAAGFRVLPGMERTAARESLSELADATERLLGEEAVRAGAWLASARLAGLYGGRAAVDRLPAAPGLPAEVSPTGSGMEVRYAELRRRVEEGEAPPEELAAEAAALLRGLGG